MLPGGSHPEETVDVSAIVIARNEEGNIVDALAAVFRTLDRGEVLGLFRTYEVLLVDSASTDRTVELASSFPVTIVRLRRTWPLSAAAGRATGARLVKGRYLLFVDGDYLMDERWLPVAWSVLQGPSVGAVCGWDLDEVWGDSVLARRFGGVKPEHVPPATDIDSIASGLIRREAYQAVGGIHPFLKGAEDRDFGMRLVANSWRIVRTQEPMGTHRFTEPGRPLTYVDYYRSVAVWSLGEGQSCRARWANPAMRRGFLSRYGNARYLIHDLMFLSIAGLLLANVAGVFLRGPASLVVFVVDAAVFAAIEAWRRRHRWTWPEALYELQGAVYGPLRQLLFARGLLKRSPPPERYPTDVELVKTGGIVAGTRPSRGSASTLWPD